jgi:hypothetical protein
VAVPSIAMFRARFPEFGTSSTDGTPDALVQLAIDAAAELADEDTCGDQHTQLVLHEAADQLARSPAARDMKLVVKGETLYGAHALRLRRICAIGRRLF